MKAHGHSGKTGRRLEGGVALVLGSGIVGSVGALAVIAAVAGRVGTAEAQTHGGGLAEGGVPTYIAAAGQGLVTPPDIEDVEHMCALLSSCDKLPFPTQMQSVPGCVQSMMNELTSPDAVKFSLSVRECGLRANSCNELRTCALRGAAPDSCAGRAKNGSFGICDLDGRAINCAHEKIVGVRDCPRGGEQCVVREGQAGCAIGPCNADSPPSCSANGARVLQCDHGKLDSFDCSALGLKCTVGPDGHPGCAPSSAPCTGTSKHCDGNVAVGCLRGHEVRVDCGAAGLACNSTPGAVPVGACVAPPATTDRCDSREAPKCDGASIKYCFAGRKRSYFCKSLGFNGCVKDGSAVRCGG